MPYVACDLHILALKDGITLTDAANAEAQRLADATNAIIQVKESNTTGAPTVAFIWPAAMPAGLASSFIKAYENGEAVVVPLDQHVPMGPPVGGVC